MEKKRTYNFSFLITILFVFSSAFAYSQDWEVPAEEKSKGAPFVFDENSVKSGEEIYNKNCVSCHGNPGQGNFLGTLNPIPPDLASEKTQNQTDGELFFKITIGKGVMPSFQNVFSSKERWQIIAYLRSFNKDYVQAEVVVDKTKLKKLGVKVYLDSLNNKLILKITLDDSLTAQNSEVTLFAERYFGMLKIDSTARTNESGLATFTLLNDLPGDKDGKLNFIVKVVDENYGETEARFDFNVGLINDHPALTEQRAMWNVMSKIPIWLLISYLSVVIGIWLFLFKMVLNILKINKLGKTKHK